MTVGLAVAALVLSLASVVVAVRSEVSSRRSSAAAQAADRRARTPVLDIVVLADAGSQGDRAIYRIRNDGPQDLDEVRVHRPEPPDRIVYPVASTGAGGDWSDVAELGPLRLTQEARFTLCCGAAENLPEFRVRVECRAGVDRWDVVAPLDSPRPPEPLVY